MKLSEYLDQERGRGARVARAARLSPAFLSQMANGLRPAPAEQCVAIELATEAAVRRWDLHAALKAICELDDIDMGVWIEAQIVPVIKKRIHDATVLANELQRLGITGSGRESSKGGTR